MIVELERLTKFLTDTFLRKYKLDESQMERFCDSLRTCLVERYDKHWYPENPERGNGFRCIRVNHKLDPVLVVAARRAGLKSRVLKNALPAELTLWIDPGSVSFRIGETGSISEIKPKYPTSDAVPIPTPNRSRHDEDDGYGTSLSMSPSPPPQMRISSQVMLARATTCHEFFARSTLAEPGFPTFVAS